MFVLEAQFLSDLWNSAPGLFGYNRASDFTSPLFIVIMWGPLFDRSTIFTAMNINFEQMCEVIILADQSPKLGKGK